MFNTHQKRFCSAVCRKDYMEMVNSGVKIGRALASAYYNGDDWLELCQVHHQCPYCMASLSTHRYGFVPGKNRVHYEGIL